MMIFSREIVTLDFEGAQLRWLTASRGAVRRWGRARLLAESGPIARHDPAALGAELAEVMHQESLSRNRVVASISGQRAIFRTLTLPALKHNLLDSAVQRKLRQEIPLQPQETDLSWTIVREDPDALEVYVVAMPREETDHLMDMLRAAKIRPASLDVKPLALLRAVNQPTASIVSLEDQALTIVVAVGGVPQVVRTVPVGASTPSAETRLELAAQELARTTKFYNESHKAQPLPGDTPMVLAGSAFDQPEMIERMRARSPYPVGALDPPITCPADLPLGEFSVNIGLALGPK